MATLNLAHLTTFRMVISRGSFSGAAEALGLSQPAVSLQIRQLEQVFQARLIERTSRGIRPTPAGMTLSEHCMKIDAVVSAAIESVSLHSDDITGTVTVGTGATACIHLLPPLLQQLRQTHPLLKVDVRTGNTSDIVRGVEENRIDIGLVTLPAAGKCLSVNPLGTDEFVIIMEKDTLGQSTKPLSPDDLLSLPLIIFEPGSGTRALIDEWFRYAGHVASPVMELGSIEAIKRMVRAGLGYSIVPRMSVRSMGERQGLSVYSMVPFLYRTLGTVMREDRIISRGISEVLKRLSGSFAKDETGT
ncbi:LysR family transcriptional regulator [Pectobacterium peruviense]|uniref:LysR family transcriptional regulator n=1 Tax=Pectobacterium peruviense TaxID=2066479 RepID=A0ABX4S5S0_9GAMM|nr:LysR family transcriptional regulator [Pectobacterium peruviense]KML69123.1 LysR family transcriptional regulator [Pectobacterium peruviense]PKX85446.1 LysR family transcriptional regulator [Pectobacterium peruviense]